MLSNNQFVPFYYCYCISLFKYVYIMCVWNILHAIVMPIYLHNITLEQKCDHAVTDVKILDRQSVSEVIVT